MGASRWLSQVALALALTGCGAAAPARDRPARTAGTAGTARVAAAPVERAAPAEPPESARDSASATDDDPCRAGEVYVPPTPAEGFTMGRDFGRDDAPHRVVLTRGFCIDADEVSAREYARCVDAGQCGRAGQEDEWASFRRHPDWPINMVSWESARKFCGWREKRLPTEAEWEWAASGPSGSKYPWGDAPEPSCDNVDYTHGGAPKWRPGGDVGCHGGGPSPIGTHPKGDKLWPGGAIHDLAGNVWEWVEDSFEAYATEPQTDPLVRRETAIHGIRGGGWNRPSTALRTAFRAAAHYEYQVPAVGFRCVRGAPHATPPPRQKRW